MLSNADMRCYVRPLRLLYSQNAQLYPRQARRWLSKYPPPAPNQWSHLSSSASIADHEVSNFASKPLYALSLADLVRCGK
jgi:hypothetical protein